MKATCMECNTEFDGSDAIEALTEHMEREHSEVGDER